LGWGSFCSRATGLFPMEILSIKFSMVFIIMSNLSCEDHDVDGCASHWGLLLPRLNLSFIFPDTIMFTSTLITLLIIASSIFFLLYVNNRVKLLSKESMYCNCAALGGSLTSVGIELYTFKKWAKNSCIVISGALFILLYCVNNCKGFFLSPHLFRKDVSNDQKS
jgi:hypothetical protein